jgi:hypothetical protein
MKPGALISDAPFPPGHQREALLFARLLLLYLADHIYSAELESGARIHDVLDMKRWLEDLAAASRDLSQNTGVLPPELRLELRQQPECPLCSHVHQGAFPGDECGVYLSELRFCKCTA